jgi:hypothetical protein
VKSFYTVLLLESRRTFARRNVAILLLFLLLSLYFVQSGIHEYQTLIGNKEKFKEVEKIKVRLFINYAQYGGIGFRLLFIPSKLSILFVNSSLITDLTANIDSADVLKIYNSLKGATLFSEKSGGFKDFSGIFFLFGTLLALFFGFETFLHKDLMRFLCGTLAPRKLFCSVMAARLLLLVLFVGLTLAGSLALMRANHLVLTGREYRFLCLQLLVMLLLQFSFFVAGAIAGTLKSRFAGFLMVIIIWFAFIFLLPGAIWSVVASRAENITPTYNLELKKLETLMGFEKNALESMGPFSAEKAQTEKGKKLILNFLTHEYSKIKKLEKQLEDEMSGNIRLFFRLSMWFPTSFYLASTNEISSKGYESYIYFFRYIQDLKENFVKFYFEKRVFENYSKIESFIKKEENIFYARPMFPDYFPLGLGLMAGYTLLLLIFAFRSFRRSLVI